VLHVSPESFIGGPLALVHDGDLISLDAEARRLDLLVAEKELAARRAKWTRPEAKFGRGYGALYTERVTQAHLGCDFDFLEPGGEPSSDPGAGETVSQRASAREPEIH
jgi:dihydroxy-acid dehydratase